MIPGGRFAVRLTVAPPPSRAAVRDPTIGEPLHHVRAMPTLPPPLGELVWRRQRSGGRAARGGPCVQPHSGVSVRPCPERLAGDSVFGDQEAPGVRTRALTRESTALLVSQDRP